MTPPVGNPASLPAPITPLFVWQAARRWWKLAAPLGALLAALSVGILYLLHEPVYVAENWLRIESESPFVVFPDPEAESFVNTQIELIRSPLVLDRVVAEPDIARYPALAASDDPIAWLAARLTVAARGKSEIYVVRFQAADPQRAARIANAVVEAYFKIQSRQHALRARRVIELLEDEKQRRGQVVRRLRESIRALQGERTEADPFAGMLLSDGEAFRHPLGELRGRVTRVEVEREVLEARLAALQESAGAEPAVPEEEIELLLDRRPQLRELQEKRAAHLVRLEEIERVARRGRDDPRYLAAQELLAAGDAALAELRSELREQILAARRRQLSASRDAAMQELQARIDALALAEEALRKRYFRQLQDVRRTDARSLELEFRRTELAREEKVFELIAARALELRTESRAPARITPLREAVPPRAPARALHVKTVSLVGAASFLLPFGLVVLRERLLRRVDDSRQLWQADLAVVGEIARLPGRRGFAPATLAATRRAARDASLFEESIDSLRTCLMLAEPQVASRALAVCSAVAGEGKTSLASQLALSVARSTGEPTLLIDADLRSPDLHHVFGVENDRGLAQVLERQCGAERAIATTESNDVYLLPAGVLQTSPHKLLGDGGFDHLLAELRSTYRHILIDTSPILSASESLVLAKSADAALLCAMRDVSRIDQVQKAYERLAGTGARPLGAILNGVPTGRYAYLYGNYAYSGTPSS